MSSFISLSSNDIACVWNSSFKTILSALEDASASRRFAARILEDNPIAAPIGGLNLTALSATELADFVHFVSDLRASAAQITKDWSTANNINQLPVDLEAVIYEARKVLTRTSEATQ